MAEPQLTPEDFLLGCDYDGLVLVQCPVCRGGSPLVEELRANTLAEALREARGHIERWGNDPRHGKP